MSHPLIQQFALYYEHNKGRAGSSVDNYTRHLNRLDIYLFNQGKELLTASRADLIAFAGLEAHKQGLLPQSRRPLVAALRAFYRWCVDEGKLEASPAADIGYPKSGKPLPTYIRRDHVERLLLSIRDLDNLGSARDVAIIALLAGCGFRASGLVSLNEESLWAETDEDGFTRHRILVTEKNAKDRIIPLPPEADLWLMAYMKHPEYVDSKPLRLLETGEHVLFAQTNRGNCPEHEWFGERRRLSRGGINRMILRRGKNLNIPRDQLKPHAFRHLFGTEMLENGEELAYIKVLMGHSSIVTTNIYTHTVHRRLADSIERGSPLANMNTPVNQIVNQMKTRVNNKK